MVDIMLRVMQIINNTAKYKKIIAIQEMWHVKFCNAAISRKMFGAAVLD